MSVRPPHRPLLLGLPLVLVAAGLTGVSVAANRATPGDVRISTLSNRADLVSAGDVLVRVRTPGASAKSARIRLNGHDIPRSFKAKSDGKGTGVVSGLHLGRNVLTATRPDGRGARL